MLFIFRYQNWSSTLALMGKSRPHLHPCSKPQAQWSQSGQESVNWEPAGRMPPYTPQRITLQKHLMQTENPLQWVFPALPPDEGTRTWAREAALTSWYSSWRVAPLWVLSCQGEFFLLLASLASPSTQINSSGLRQDLGLSIPIIQKWLVIIRKQARQHHYIPVTILPLQ